MARESRIEYAVRAQRAHCNKDVVVTMKPSGVKKHAVKTSVAWSIDNKTVFYADKIDGNLASIKASLPRSIDGVPVTPIPTGDDERQSHFRLEGRPTPGKGHDRGESSQVHADMQRFLLKRLRDAGACLDVFTMSAEKDVHGRRLRSPLFSLPDVAYHWAEEPETRMWMNHSSYFQPDIAGRVDGRFTASPALPTVIVEVVHQHWPNLATWWALVRFSRINHWVLFYVITEREDERVWEMNFLNKAGTPRMSLSVQLYLHNGFLYHGISRVNLVGDTLVERYQSAMGFVRGVVGDYIADAALKRCGKS